VEGQWRWLDRDLRLEEKEGEAPVDGRKKKGRTAAVLAGEVARPRQRSEISTKGAALWLENLQKRRRGR
jgi:hypothetical protein